MEPIMTGYVLADKILSNIRSDKNHEISLNDAIRVVSFWGFNEESLYSTEIGFICYCARNKIKQTLENAIIWKDFALFDKMVKIIKSESEE